MLSTDAKSPEIRHPKSYSIGPKAKPFEPDRVYLYVELWPFPWPQW